MQIQYRLSLPYFVCNGVVVLFGLIIYDYFFVFISVQCTGNVFQAYDFGRKGNLLRYGSIKPFEYQLEKITAPVFMFL